MAMKHIASSILCFAAMSSLSSHAFAGASVDDLALCKAVLTVKSKQDGLTLQEQLNLIRASDWFKEKGIAAGNDRYANMEVSYLKAFTEARDNGDKQYGAAVKGCLDYHASQTG